MRRTTLILMAVLMFTVLDGGHGPGSTQALEPPMQALEVSISGASGRNVRQDIQNPVIFWWTAPATGPVTFDTEGSDLDTLLWVEVDYFDGSGQIAFNDDVDERILQSAVHFTAVRGLEYAIAVDDHSEWQRAGTIVLNWQLEPLGCEGPPTPPVADLSGPTLRGIVLSDDHFRRFKYEHFPPTIYILAGQNASIMYWYRGGVQLIFSLYVSMDGSESVSINYDGNGYPRTVVDECSGNWMRIHNYGNNNGVDFWFYDADDTPLHGLALYQSEGRYYYGKILDEPIHAGKYTAGESKTKAGIARYELYVKPPEVTNARPVPAEIVALMDALSQDGTRSTGLSFPGSRSRLAAILKPLGALLSPGVAHAAIPGSGDLLQTGGALVAGMGLLSGIVGGTVAAVSAPLVAAGVTVYMAGRGLNMIHAEIRDRLDDDADVVNGDIESLTIDHLTDSVGRGVSGFAQNMKDWLVRKKANVRDKIDRGKRALRSLVFEPNPPDFTRQLDDTWLPHRPPPPDMESERPTSEVVVGSWTVDGTTVSLRGSISTHGSFQATDSSGDIVLSGGWRYGDDPHEITHNQQPPKPDRT